MIMTVLVLCAEKSTYEGENMCAWIITVYTGRMILMVSSLMAVTLTKAPCGHLIPKGFIQTLRTHS